MATQALGESIKTARRQFFDGGVDPHGLVPELILHSWQRCAGLGLHSTTWPVLEPLQAPGINEQQQRYEALRRVSRPELEALYADARMTGSIVVLTSPDGMILDARGSADFLGKAARVALRPGVVWAETSTGTNAVGTAMVERRPVEVRGAEHYFAPLRVLSCSASPILDHRGELAGVLDMSGDAQIHQVHALGMVRLAVDQIEHRLFNQLVMRHATVVRLHHDSALLGTSREGLLAFEGSKLVAANRYALDLLGLSWDEIDRGSYEAMFASGLPRAGSSGVLRDHAGNFLHAHVASETSTRPPSAALAASAAAVTTPMRGVRASQPAAVIFDGQVPALMDRAVRIFNAELPVLLQGETGAGKEIFARELHRRSLRGNGKLVAINCAALPEGLIEAELFGYSSGAFTGARREGATGLLREADGGVLFLDEIGDMPLALQSRLLRVLQDKSVAPLGGGAAVKVDFAIICATHCDLEQAIAAGRFRSDLYYRIAQHVVRLPALRDIDDRAAVIRRLWQLEDDGAQLDDDALALLAAAPWPGNYRQLSGVLRSLRVLAENARVGVDDLPIEVRHPIAASEATGPLAVADTDLNSIEEAVMRQALIECGNNVSAAARRLGISRSTLYRRVKSDEPG